MTEPRRRAYRGLTIALLRSYRRRKLTVLATTGALLVLLLFMYQAPKALANLSDRKVKLGVESTVLTDRASEALVRELRASARISVHGTSGAAQDTRELQLGLSDAVLTRTPHGLAILSAGPYGRLADATVANVVVEHALTARGGPEPALTRTRLGDHAQLLNTSLPGMLALGLLEVGFGLSLTSLMGLRRSGMLRQIRTAGASARTVVASVVSANLVVAAVQVLALVVVGTRLAGADGSPWQLGLIALLGFVTMAAAGVSAATFGKNLQSTTIFSGVALSLLAALALVPIPNISNSTAQTVMSLTPTGAMSEAFRAALHGPDHRSLSLMLVVLVGWCAVLGLVAARSFRWDRVSA